MKGPKPKSRFWDLFVKLAFSVSEALKNTEIASIKHQNMSFVHSVKTLM